MKSRGVEHVAAAILSAREAGATPADLEAIVRHFDAHAGAWGPAALQKRIKNFLRGQPPDSEWPKPSPKFSEAKTAARKAAHQAEELRRKKLQDEAKQREYAQREAEFGSILDGWSDAEVREFVLAQNRPTLSKELKDRGRDNSALRKEILRLLALANRQAETA